MGTNISNSTFSLVKGRPSLGVPRSMQELDSGRLDNLKDAQTMLDTFESLQKQLLAMDNKGKDLNPEKGLISVVSAGPFEAAVANADSVSMRLKKKAGPGGVLKMSFDRPTSTYTFSGIRGAYTSYQTSIKLDLAQNIAEYTRTSHRSRLY